MQHSFFSNVFEAKQSFGSKIVKSGSSHTGILENRKNKVLDQIKVLTSCANYGVNSYHCSFPARSYYKYKVQALV